jgi:MurNAc alpha-1-phosphate uridylyltransferase
MKPQKAMILAAGRGERMRPLTDNLPKPLLEVGGSPLIQHHVESLVKAGFKELVINHAHLGYKIEEFLGDGSRFGCHISYSAEGQGRALETGGGIFKVLDQFEGLPFLVINADVWTDMNYADLSISEGVDAHLVMVSNPSHNREGDFVLEDHRLSEHGSAKLTFSGVGIYKPRLFEHCQPGKFPLAPLLKQAMSKGRVSGEKYKGLWIDVGTPERLETINRLLNQ